MVEVQKNKPLKDDRTASSPDCEENWDNKPLLDRESFLTEFDSDAYLKDFYSNVSDPAMQMVIRFLPGIAVRLPECRSLLDFGCGPTIHVSVIFRHRVQRIYLADYLPQNREELQNWINDQSTFDWGKTLRMVATCEGTDWSELDRMQVEAKSKIAGILYCNCLGDPVVQASNKIYGSLDIVVSLFTLEYCCNNYNEYKDAIRRVVSLVKKGGFFIMGGILEETWCSFGGQCLRENGLIVDLEDRKRTILYEINGMFLLAAQKTSID